MSEQRFGRYIIKRQIGQGGMGKVYLAHDPRFQREVVLKVLTREVLEQAGFSKRFDREARTMANLEHFAIIPVYDYGEHDGQPFLVMRYMQGGALDTRLQHGSLGLVDIEHILRRVAAALDKAHANQIIHRDVKPANILFDVDDAAYLGDFGIVRLTGATQTRTILGTPHYMSPEQGQGLDIDGRSDIYSLGVVLFEMLTGERPYKGETPIAMVFQHISAPIPSVREINPNLPESIDDVVNRAIAKVPNDRFSTAGELASAFTQAMQQPVATPSPLPQSSSFPVKRYGIIGAAVLIVGIVIAFLSGAFNPSPPTSDGEVAEETPIVVSVLQTGTLEPSPTLMASATATNTATATEMVEPTMVESPIPTSTIANTSTPDPTDTPEIDTLESSLITSLNLELNQNANLRTGPGTAFGSILILSRGDAVTAFARNQNGSWFNVMLSDERTGWLAASVVNIIDDGDAAQVEIAVTIPNPPPTETPIPTEPPTAVPDSGGGGNSCGNNGGGNDGGDGGGGGGNDDPTPAPVGNPTPAPAD